jgi:hypothetical protein
MRAVPSGKPPTAVDEFVLLAALLRLKVIFGNKDGREKANRLDRVFETLDRLVLAPAIDFVAALAIRGNPDRVDCD